MSFKSDRERPIVDTHEQQLKRVLNLGESDAIPENIVDLYWDITRTARSLGMSIGDRELLLILILANRPIQEQPVSFLDTLKEQQIQPEHYVLAKFRNQWRWGNYKKVVDEKVIVVLRDDTGEERTFKATNVRLPTKDEEKLLEKVV